MDNLTSGIKLESWLVSAGRSSDPGAPLNVPLVPASNFIIGKDREYSRDDGTPTWEALEEIMGGLESGKAVAFASGMAAIAAVFDQLPVGSVVALPDDCYQGVAGLVAAGVDRKRWSVERVRVDDTAGWIRACSIADLIFLSHYESSQGISVRSSFAKGTSSYRYRTIGSSQELGLENPKGAIRGSSAARGPQRGAAKSVSASPAIIIRTSSAQQRRLDTFTYGRNHPARAWTPQARRCFSGSYLAPTTLGLAK